MDIHTPPALAYQIPDAARQLGIGRSLAYELAKTGKLRITKIGGRSVITATELKRFLEEAEAASQQQAAA